MKKTINSAVMSYMKEGPGRMKRKISVLNNERGIALVMVLVLSLIALAIMATLIYMVIQGTKFSGAYKRYATALDAGHGGTELITALIGNRGVLQIPYLETPINMTGTCNCGFDADPYDEDYPDPDPKDTPDHCICWKLCMPPVRSDGTPNWPVACDSSFDPKAMPDILDESGNAFHLKGFDNTEYTVFAKIVDTTVGVTDLSGEDLGCGTGAAYTCGTFSGPPTPYLYRIEVESQDTNNTQERARLSVLYAY
jgi:hypothetical protein